MDMLDVYVDDYTQFEPLPDAMRLRLPSARDFLLDSEHAALEAADASGGTGGETQQSPVAIARGDVDAEASPGDGGEGCDLAADDAKLEPTSALTGLPTAVSSDVPSVEDPAGPLHEASSTAGPLGKPIAPDPTST